MTDDAKPDTPEAKRAKFEKVLGEAEQFQQKHTSQWRTNVKVYHGTNAPQPTTATRKQSRDAALYIPYAEQQIDTIRVRLVEPNPSFKYHPTEPSDEAQLNKISALRHYHRRRDDYVRKQDLFVHDALIYQLCVAKVSWAHSERTVTRKRKLNPLQKFFNLSDTVTTNIVDFDQPTVTVVDPFDFFWDPAATNDRDWKFVIHRVWLTGDELKDRAKAGIYNADAVDKMISQRRSGRDSVGGTGGDAEDNGAAVRKDRFEVFEYWTCEKVETWGDRKELLREADNPFDHGQIPFAASCTQPLRGSLVGRSEVEQIESLQDYLWTIDGLRVEGAKRAINPPLKYKRGMKGGKDIKIVPGGRIGVDSMNDIELLQLQPGQSFGVEEGQILLGQMQNMTGANSYLSGADSSLASQSQNTATGISLIQQEANRRMAAKMLNLQMFHARIEDMSLQLEQQFLSEDQFVRIVGPGGEEWLKVTAQDIAGLYDVEPEWESLEMNRERERTSNIELITTLQNLDGMKFADGTTVNAKPALEGLIRSYDRDPAPYFVETAARVQQELDEQKMHLDFEAQNAPPDQGGAQPPHISLLEKVDYKDMPVPAKTALLIAAGLPGDGVQDTQPVPAPPAPKAAPGG